MSADLDDALTLPEQTGSTEEPAEREELLVAIEEEKIELRRALDDLQQAVVAKPREQLGKHAVGLLVGGFVVGMAIAIWTGRAAPAPPG